MQKPLNYEGINWVDGMKLSSGDFVHTDLFTQDLVRDSISIGINDSNFGLLPAFAGYERSFDISLIKKNTNYLEVEVRFCNAITSDGNRINIAYQQGNVEASFSAFMDVSKLAQGEHYVVLYVNSFKRSAFGEPNPEESPLRYPYVKKDYLIDIVSKSDINQRQVTGSFLPIGKLIQEEQETILVQQYIMPSVYLESHPQLMDFHNRFYRSLNEFQTAAYKIMDKTVNRPKITELGLNIRFITEKILEYMATSFFEYRSILPQRSALYLLKYFSDFAHVFFNAVRLVEPAEREEMLKYFYEWKDVTPGNFEERLSNLIEMRYNHFEIAEAMGCIADFMNVMVSLWGKLATLEYIGQRRENIVVAEQKVVQEVQTRRTWSLLD
ncbi:MAG: hypothetical protein LBF27_29420 [Sphingobacterium sp.]|jgi:hypothetical protein|nr:hypothetical protein [Sphingobacterium sp.]